MKFLETPAFVELCNRIISNNDETKISSRLEAYSCKPMSEDKKLIRDLTASYEGLLARSPTAMPSTSPFGPLTEPASRKAFSFLISTLNAAFPNYDFSGVEPEEFTKEANLPMVVNSINTLLESHVQDYTNAIQDELWAAIDDQIRPADCSIYSFHPEPGCSPFDEGESIWCFFFFFFNKERKRVVFFSCNASRHHMKYDVGSDSERTNTDEVTGGDVSEEEFMMDME
eukprot:TRINITY_DN28_c1_g1_i1.p1 TRINITY_DN28_c1_g1~~TRINITY_DN28_c1_g1_i1.p1  ORF type:complete len:228 (-),score=43.14 TRINITY_DN28_c1_g1_i1:318-1001(-)